MKGTPQEPAIPDWNPITRAGFRFCLAYFGLYILATQILGGLLLIPDLSFRGLGPLWPAREITLWFADRVFGLTSTLALPGNSLDTDFLWVQTFWLVLLGVLFAAVWSLLDRERRHYAKLHQWFRTVVRLGLAAQMFEYGVTKVIPVQFPAPPLVTLVTPVSNLSLQGLLWTSIGASTPYQMFTGLAEVLGGILLLIPQTTLAGALICLADLVQVFTLNMSYDVGVKLFSFHLILLSLFLLAPDFPRLLRFFVLNRASVPPAQPRLFQTQRANRIALAAQILFGVLSLGMHTYLNWVYWHVEGGRSPRSPLYGIWNVAELSVDGEVRPAALNDYDRRWRRVIFDEPGNIVFQRTDDSFARYGASIDVDTGTISLTKGGSRSWRADFRFQRPARDRLELAGEMDGYDLRLRLQLVEFDTMRLLNSDFRWLRPPDP